MSGLEVLVVVLAMVAGAVAQASSGFGITLISAPVLVAVEPAFLPLPMMIGGMTVGLRHLVRERSGIEWSYLSRCLVGMPIGVALGHLATGTLSESGLKVAVGVLIVLAVVLVAVGWAPQSGRWTAPVCGLLVAFGTRVAALPGPPFVILHHDRPPSMIRPNLSALNLVNLVVIVTIMATAGQVTAADLGRGALVAGSAAIGLVVAPPVRRWVDRRWFRPLVLVLAGLGGLAVVVGEVV